MRTGERGKEREGLRDREREIIVIVLLICVNYISLNRHGEHLHGEHLRRINNAVQQRTLIIMSPRL